MSHNGSQRSWKLSRLTRPLLCRSSSALERRLEELSTPTKGQVERGVKVEMKGVAPPDKVGALSPRCKNRLRMYLVPLQAVEL